MSAPSASKSTSPRPAAFTIVGLGDTADPRGPGARPHGAAELRLRVPAVAHRRQPRARASAQGGLRVRPRDRVRRARRQRPGPARGARTPSGLRRALADRCAAAVPRDAGGGPGRAGGRTESWLVDIKGRQFPTAKCQYWRNWSTADELSSLASWEELFGPRFTGLLVFAYNVIGDQAPLPADELFEYRNSLYGFVGIRLDHYTSFSRPLSPRWGTVTVSIPQFRARLARHGNYSTCRCRRKRENTGTRVSLLLAP